MPSDIAKGRLLMFLSDFDNGAELRRLLDQAIKKGEPIFSNVINIHPSGSCASVKIEDLFCEFETFEISIEDLIKMMAK